MAWLAKAAVLVAMVGASLIRTKVVDLLDCDEPQGNNSFIL